MKDARIIIPRKELEIVIAKFYRLKDVFIEGVTAAEYKDGIPIVDGICITANYLKRRKHGNA